MENLFDYLSSKTYPGRGIVVFHPKETSTLLCAYWIMGRSENSRNRVFEEVRSENSSRFSIRTVAADETKIEDPHLIIYNARLSIDEKNIVIITNGDQTDTIAQFVEDGNDENVAFMKALETRTFEDDSPNFTPRISVMVNAKSGNVSFSSLQCADVEKQTTVRNFSFYDQVGEGQGYLLTTYVDNGNPLPSGSLSPIKVECKSQNSHDFIENIWKSLDDDNKISLYIEEIDLNNGNSKCKLINKYNRLEA